MKAATAEPPTPPALERVAEYVRMSTDHQRYSIENQQATIADYANTHRMVVEKTYSDPGRSGLTLAGRPGLRALLNEVTSGHADFSAVLIYDVSRWGRFQDTDESAHYEFLLRSAGMRVIYCAEPFENDGTALSSIMKTIKRTMAGEHSREMSVKIRASRRRNEPKGYWHGAQIPMGVRRVSVDAEGNICGELREKQRKHLPSHHVRLIPGPPEEIAAVREVFRQFVEDRATLVGICAWLSEEGRRRPYDRPWTPEAVRYMLTNEIYIGNLMRGKYACALGGPNKRQPRERWRRTEAALEPIVDRKVFHKAQSILAVRWRIRSDEEILDALRDLLRRRGRLSLTIVEQDPWTPSNTVLRRRFGGLMSAYEKVGYKPLVSGAGILLEVLEQHRQRLRKDIVSGFEQRGLPVRRLFGGRLLIDDRLLLGLSVLHPLKLSKSGPPAWRLMRADHSLPDVRVVLRLDGPSSTAMDYLVIPKAGHDAQNLTLHKRPRPPYDRFRHNTLAPLFALVAAQLLELKVKEGVI